MSILPAILRASFSPITPINPMHTKLVAMIDTHKLTLLANQINTSLQTLFEAEMNSMKEVMSKAGTAMHDIFVEWNNAGTGIYL
jgi:hypothetical protein